MRMDTGTTAWSDEMIGKGRVAATDVTRLSNDLCPMGLMTLDEAGALFRVEREVLDKHPSWAPAFTTLVCDCLVWGDRPTGVLSDERAEWILKLAVRTRTQAAEDLLRLIASEAAQAPAWFIKAVGRRGQSMPMPAAINLGERVADCAA